VELSSFCASLMESNNILVRFSDMCGAEIPRWIRQRLDVYKDNSEAMSGLNCK